MFFGNVSAQIPPEKLVKISVVPNHADWLYEPGERVISKVSVNEFIEPLKNTSIHYEVGQERQAPTLTKDVSLTDGTLTIDGGTLKEPGFLRCVVTAEVAGNKYRSLATAGFAPETIQPVAEMPFDFLQFWNAGKKELAGFPMDNKMVLLSERCTQNVNV